MQDSVYEKNIDALNIRHGVYVRYMCESDDNNIKIIDEEADITPYVTDVAGKKALVVQKGEKIYRLDSLYDSEPILNVWFSGLKDEWDLNSRLYMYGLGNGMFVRKFLQSARKDCTVVVHEPSLKIFKTVLENFDLSDIFSDERVRLVLWSNYIGNSVRSVYESIFRYTDINSLAGSNHLNYPQLFPKDCSAYIDGMERVKAFVAANQTVNDHFGSYFSRNVFGNLSLVKESYDIKRLAEIVPDGNTAIVVAAGPSLDKNIHEIAKAKGKCIIVSTDTALKPLSLAGIVPDITAVMDGKKDVRYLSEQDSRSVPIVCVPRAGTDFLHLHTGKKFFVNDFSDHLNGFLASKGHAMIKLDTGGSVANACFAIAKYLHCKTIILVGQDLAYTGDKTHSAVTVRGAKKTAIEDLQHVVMAVDINGNPIRSSAEFQLYKEWFEQRINRYKDLEVIDATEGGIKIEGTKIMPLRQAIEEYCTKEIDFSKIVERAEPLLDERTKEEFKRFIISIPNELKEVRSIIRSTMADYASMRRIVQRNDYHGSQMKRLYENTKKQTKKIESMPIVEYVHVQLQGKSTELLDKVNKLEQDEKQELLTVCDIGEQYLRDMDTAILELEPYMDVLRQNA